MRWRVFEFAAEEVFGGGGVAARAPWAGRQLLGRGERARRFRCGFCAAGLAVVCARALGAHGCGNQRNRSRYAQQIRDLAAPGYAHSAPTCTANFRLDIAHGRVKLR
jgi:hypothetical protein